MPTPPEAARAAAPLGPAATWLVFGGFGCALYVATRPGLAALVGLGVRPDVAWFVAGGAVFLAALLAGIVALHREGHAGLRAALVERCRFRRLGARGWGWAIGATLAVLAVTGLLQALLLRTVAGFSPQPPFMQMSALGPGERWVLLAWLPMFALNILGEELLWHGVLLPRNEAHSGKYGWLVNAGGWWLFHLPFGPWLSLLLLPVVFIETWAVHRGRNTWVGVAVHATLNGPAFVAIALGIL